jgi:hypothetical protein
MSPPLRTAGSPTVTDIRDRLERALGAEFDAAWADLCERANIRSDVPPDDELSIEVLLDQVALRDPLCQVMSLSWRIRRTANRKLHALGR